MTRRNVSVRNERFPIAGSFTISRGSKTEASVVVCRISDGNVCGAGECVPYGRYGETVESVIAQIESLREAIAAGLDRATLAAALPQGAARNAIDCALWDLEAKATQRRVADMIGIGSPLPLETAVTISLGSPDEMARQAHGHAGRPVIKIKVGSDDDVSRMRAVAAATPGSRLIVDANEAWSPETIGRHFDVAAELGIALIEQPLPAGQDACLREIHRPVPVCADESVHSAADLDTLVGLYDAINIKLDKAGGLTPALELRDRARTLGFGVMVGCMVGSSLSMAPAVLVAQGADFVDLDGPLLLAQDRTPALRYEGSKVYPPEPELWG